ncbi:kinase-like domain-containing protein [Pisolithus sp. B1]|nr:kinase-like domain-containing protein [Pisolithus sp. B1]
MDQWRSHPLQNHNPLGSHKVPGRVPTDVRNHDVSEQVPRSLRIHPSMSNKDQERGSTSQDVRQRENDRRPRQALQPPVVGNARNPGYDVPRNVPQQVRSPAESRREQTTLPLKLEAGREGEPPTPRRERAVDSQGLDSWHYDTLRSLPQVTQPPRNVPMSASGGNPSHGMTANVSFSRKPPDLTPFVKQTDQYAHRRGGFADVWKCTFYRGGNSRGGELVAVKCIRLLGEQSQQEIDKVIKRLQGEVYLWAKLTPHEHVLPLYGTVNGFGHLPAMVSPWAENGTLTSYVERDRRRLSYDRELKIILQVTSGLHHLHSNNICHGDLTGSNILINGNEDAIISDFGLSSIVAEFNHTSYFQSCRPGAMRWADPQLVIDSMDADDGSLPEADMKNDIYSMGCVMLLVASGLTPYHGKSDWIVQFAKYKRQNPVIPPTVSPILANLMVGCWDNDHRRRPRLGEIREVVQRELTSLQR